MNLVLEHETPSLCESRKCTHFVGKLEIGLCSSGGAGLESRLRSRCCLSGHGRDCYRIWENEKRINNRRLRRKSI